MQIEIEKLAEKNLIQNDCSEIVKISSDELTYNQFFEEFLLKNNPVIIKNANILTSTSSSWIRENYNEKYLNIDELEKVLKDQNVPVYNCSKQYFNSHEIISMKFSEYANYWRNECSDRNDLLYLKDFHLKQEIPHLDFYNFPHIFASDWLNEYAIDENKDDYRFVYIGVKGTWTPFHSDVFGSYSWSANVIGQKRWILLPPQEELKLRDKFNKLPFKIDTAMLQESNAKYFDIIQEPNEILFVPSLWYHQVENLTNVFSINHNFFNGCNIHKIFDSLLRNYDDVKQEISDCSDMENFEDHCQVVLRSLFGMNFEDFIKLLNHIRCKRIDKEGSIIFDKFILGKNHTEYDIEMIKDVIVKFNEIKILNDDLKIMLNEIIKDDDNK